MFLYFKSKHYNPVYNIKYNNKKHTNFVEPLWLNRSDEQFVTGQVYTMYKEVNLVQGIETVSRGSVCIYRANLGSGVNSIVFQWQSWITK